MVVPPSTGVNATGQDSQSSTARSSNKMASSHPKYGSNVPLSARRSEPLDLSTVERRGQPSSASQPPSHRVRPQSLQDAPTFCPTEEEFKDPLAYIRKIAPEGKKYGICKVVPPEGWDPKFAIDTERFHFKTRRQELNSVEGGTRANLNYLDQLTKFHKQHGTNLTRFPSVDKRPLDLYKLKKAVDVRGGFDQVCKMKKWAEIGRDLGYSGKIMSSLSTSLKNSFQRWLQPYEEYLLVAKPGVQHQLEIEHGGPYVPSPQQSPAHKRPNSSKPRSSDVNGELPPAEKPPATPNTPAAAPEEQKRKTPTPENAPSTPAPAAPPPATTCGFTAVNANPNRFAAPPIVKQEAENGNETPARTIGTPVASAVNGTPERRPDTDSGAMTNGHDSQPLKRTQSHDSLALNSQGENGENGDIDLANGRRSKRLKKDSSQGAHTVVGSHMSLLRPTPPHARSKNGNRKQGERCENCGGSDDGPSILSCDGCDNGYHMKCLDPPLTSTPDYDWHCPKCLVGTGEYGFEEGGIYSLKQFQEKADNFKRNYFRAKMPFDPVLNAQRAETEDDVEQEFWRLVESLTETVEVEYGADIHSTTHGSGFPTVERNPLDPYSMDPWNLNVLPLHGDSLFRHIKSDVSGMTVPWLYVGMCFSTFCWHNEDHYTYSANYQHFGATKTWYGIPGDDAEAFEEAMRRAVPELFETQPDLLFQLVTLLPPEQLKKAGVNVYAVDQHAGQFVLTFPQAYHAGFNHGFNFNEAVNFAPSDWEPVGQAGVERLQAFRRQPCFSHDELLLTAAGSDTSIKTAKWLGPALRRTCSRELEQRSAFISSHQEAGAHECKLTDADKNSQGRCELEHLLEETDLPEEESQCAYCKVYSYLTQFRCKNTEKTLCLLHAGSFDCCREARSERMLGPNHTLRYRLSDDELEGCVQKVEERARVPEAWSEKLEALLEDEPKPSLKALHTLLAEGERIPHHLPGLEDLSNYVKKCDKWLDEANNYITRKQQNRRKNEKLWRKGTRLSQVEERDRELRNVDKLRDLLTEAENLSFDCPQIATLREKVEDIQKFQTDAQEILCNPHVTSTQEVEELVEVGRNFNVDIPEIDKLDKALRQMKWNDEARRKRDQYQTIKECRDFINEGVELGLAENNEHLQHFRELLRQGETWESKATELMAVETVHYQQLEALSAQAARFPVSAETLSKVDAILTKQREAQKHIAGFYEASKSEDFRKRPHYQEVRDMMESLAQLNSKPNGTIDLEREQKRHEDWMRKGKKLFGKANAPLHILKMHMQYVEKRNSYCFDLEDRCRPPVEPASREASPDGMMEVQSSWIGSRSRKKDVFCICRQQEAGLMIECEVCHEWYHGKCLKIARGKVKEYDSYTCPICDWRVKIPRDAARPKLEDLLEWQAEMPDLPFQPEEEDLLENIVDQATSFRDFLRPFTNPACMTSEEVPTQIFYLRKIEGAEVLLTYETNYFRQEIHKWAPVAPQPPPILEQSLSTRKPRPTKTQKMMAQYGVERPEDLPLHLRTKHHSFGPKRKSMEPQSGQTPLLQPSQEGTPNTAQNDQRPASNGDAQRPTTSAGPTGDSQSPVVFNHPNSYPLSSDDSSPSYGAVSGNFIQQDNNPHSPTFAPGTPASRHQGLDPSLFSPPSFDRSHHLEPGSQSAMSKHNAGVDGEVENQNPFGSSPRANMDDLFADLTNQDSAPVEGLEMSHANEALEALRSASNSGTRESSGDTLDDTNRERQGGVGDTNREGDANDSLADQFLS